MSFKASTPAEDPLLRRGIIKNPSWRIKRPAGYISKYSNSSALWKSIVENKWCIGFFTLFAAGIIFSFMMRMALHFRYRENQMGNSSPRGTKPAGVICAIALKFLSKIVDGELDFW